MTLCPGGYGTRRYCRSAGRGTCPSDRATYQYRAGRSHWIRAHCFKLDGRAIADQPRFTRSSCHKRPLLRVPCWEWVSGSRSLESLSREPQQRLTANTRARMTGVLDTAEPGGTRKTAIQMELPALGRVTARLPVTINRLQIQIQTADSRSSSKLTSRASELVRSLHDSGLYTESLTIGQHAKPWSNRQCRGIALQRRLRCIQGCGEGAGQDG